MWQFRPRPLDFHFLSGLTDMTNDGGGSAGKGSAQNGAEAAANMGKGVEAAADHEAA